MSESARQATGTSRFVVEGLVVLAACAALLSYYQFQHPWLPDTDSYYHIKLAYLYRTEGIFREFKWATMSLWKDKFSDTSFLFHVFLVPFTYFADLQTGAKVAVVTAGSLTFSSFYLVLRLNGIRQSWIWLVLLCSGGAFFLWRMSVCRPQVLSLCMDLWAAHFILNRRYRAIGVVCFVYALSYTAGHLLPVVFAGVFLAGQYVGGEKPDVKVPIAAAVGAALGVVINPFFPNQFLYFYLQNWYVLAMGISHPLSLSMGGEFYPMDTRVMLEHHVSILAPLLGTFLTAFLFPRRINPKALSLFFMAVIFLVMTGFVRRFAEYAVPFTLLFCAFYFDSRYDEFTAWLRRARPRVVRLGKLGLGVALSLIFVNSHVLSLPWYRGTRPSAFREPALRLREIARPDDIVYTCEWDDAPELFFFDDAQRYLIFLDPNFFYYWNPELWRRWVWVSNAGAGAATYDNITNVFGARYVVCQDEFTGLRRILDSDQRAKLILDNGRAYLYELQ
jgi:hypothetical protein